MKVSTLEGLAFCLILGVGVCADSLAETPGGMVVFLGGVALSGILIHAAHPNVHTQERDRSKARGTHKRGPVVPLHFKNKRPSEGKRKAAAVVGTPQRHVKQTHKSISHPYFTGAKGECQIEFFELQNDRRTATGR